MQTRQKLVSIVVPFFNEAGGIASFRDRLVTQLELIADVMFEVVCVDDGSKDATLAELRAVAADDGRFKVVELSRNFGKEAALVSFSS